MCLPTIGAVMRHSRAAAAKLPRSTASTKIRMPSKRSMIRNLRFRVLKTIGHLSFGEKGPASRHGNKPACISDGPGAHAAAARRAEWRATGRGGEAHLPGLCRDD